MNIPLHVIQIEEAIIARCNNGNVDFGLGRRHASSMACSTCKFGGG